MFRIAPIAVALSLSFCIGGASAQSVTNASRAMSDASALSVHGASTIVRGSVEVVAGASQLTVASIAAGSGVATVVLRDLSKGGEISLQVAGEIAAAASLAVGSVVQVVAEATGYTLMHAGRVVGFIPNEVGKAMVRQARQTGPGR